MKSLSLILCTYNRAESLRETLETLRAQEIPGTVAVEVVIVNNNSKDNTAEVAQKFTASPGLFKAKYVFEAKQGLSHARNSGIEASTGEVLAFLDDDVLVDPLWVKGICSCFQETDCDAMGGRIEMKWMCARPDWLTDDLKAPLISQDLGPVRKAWKAGDRTYLGANMAFRRRVFEKCGNFRVDLGRKGNSLIGGEDREFFERIAAAGFKILYDPAAVVHHRVEPERLTRDFFRKWYRDIGRTFGHTAAWRWHHAFTIAPAWIWKEVLGALARFTKVRLTPGSSDIDRFRSEIWLLHHGGAFKERFVHWLPFGTGKKLCPFYDAGKN
ncbi:MAG TPA: glycosyltransferase [Verrucomicrobiae bacterium]|nr:glycosyltransferase [Verrucomicrobiae bacterium]